jgi:hypothetical protein
MIDLRSVIDVTSILTCEQAIKILSKIFNQNPNLKVGAIATEFKLRRSWW